MWNKADKLFNIIGSILSAVSVGAVTVLGIMQVLCRYVFKLSVPWTEEMMRALFIYIVFFGLILVERENGEVRTTMLIEKLPGRAFPAFEVFLSVFSILFNVLLLIGSFQAWGSTNTSLSSLPWLSMKMFFVPIIISLPLMIIYQCYYLVKHVNDAIHGKEDKEA